MEKLTAAKYGLSQQGRKKQYNYVLEVLESQANKKLISEYEKDIKNVLARTEMSSSVNPSMMDLQPELRWFMRPYLLDFLIELHSSFRLQLQTLFLCLNIIDRYCSRRIVFKRHYQLVGCTALWIAGKFEDKKSRVPTLRELAIMCRNAYDEEMFTQMEMHILSTLEWSLSHPTLEECLQLAINCSDLSSPVTPCKYNKFAPSNSLHNNSKILAVTAIGRFLCELSLYDRFFLSVPNSLIAVTANLLACSMLQLPNAVDSLKKIMTTFHEKTRDAVASERDDDIENREPEIPGPFLSSFDKNTLNYIRKICLMLILQLSYITDVLSRKYEEVGVIQVVRNFNVRYNYIIAGVYEERHIMKKLVYQEIESSPKLCNFADTLLQLPSPLSADTDDNQIAPVTPPSATSQYSVFSNRSLSSVYATPIHVSSNRYPGSDAVDGFSPGKEVSSSIWSSPVAGKININK